MNYLDWTVLISTLLFIVSYGIWRTRGSKSMEGYLRGDNADRWYTIGLSVMATQASAVTFLSTTGQAYESGMGFVQFYFGLPLAIIIICVVFIPIYYRLKVYTAYEYLESRFDLKTRLLTATLFLFSRALAAGITIYAPSIVLSTLFGWDLRITNIGMGLLVILYTVSGGTKAVSVTQKQQLAVIFAGMFIAFYFLLDYLPENIGFSQAIDLAGAAGRMQIIDTSFNPDTRYTLWSGLAGGLFLSLSYFGTDQSQVQRYLSGTSVTQSRMGLIFNGLMKIPMQFFILLTGIMVFAFYQFEKPPVFFNQEVIHTLEKKGLGSEISTFEEKHAAIFAEKKALALHSDSWTPADKAQFLALHQADTAIRNDFKAFVKTNVSGKETRDTDYVFLTFILNYLPHGLIGLLIAVILCAAMSSTSGEISALASTTMVDFYRRLGKGNHSDTREVHITRLLTLFWGMVTIGFALSASLVENLIQLVNIVGSLFYGTILGVFLVGFFFKKIKGNAVFAGAIVAEGVVVLTYLLTDWSFLWLNPLGCTVVILASYLFQQNNNTRETVA